jgi:hypothetical protein
MKERKTMILKFVPNESVVYQSGLEDRRPIIVFDCLSVSHRIVRVKYIREANELFDLHGSKSNHNRIVYGHLTIITPPFALLEMMMQTIENNAEVMHVTDYTIYFINDQGKTFDKIRIESGSNKSAQPVTPFNTHSIDLEDIRLTAKDLHDIKVNAKCADPDDSSFNDFVDENAPVDEPEEEMDSEAMEAFEEAMAKDD